MPNFCPACGQPQNDNTASFCSNCGKQLNPNSASPTSNIDANEEVIIMSGLCNRVKNPLYVQNGKAMLTNKRFIYLKHSFAKMFVIGALVNLTAGDFEFDIPVEDIQSLEDARQGVSKTLKIHTRSGDTYHFYFTNLMEWKIALTNAINK